MARSKQAIKKEAVKSMKELGVYKPQFGTMINNFAGMQHQYEVFEEKFAEQNYQITESYTNKAGATNDRKVPIYTAMESLRKDIATYSDKLGLNPKALETIKVEKPANSMLNQILKGM